MIVIHIYDTLKKTDAFPFLNWEGRLALGFFCDLDIKKLDFVALTICTPESSQAVHLRQPCLTGIKNVNRLT